jgi:hypothetical protein
VEILDNIKNWLQPLILTGKYNIVTLDYNAGCFGNICVVLESKIGVNIQIVRDRDIMDCSVGLKINPFSNWVPIEYALEYYNFNYPDIPNSMEDYFAFICKLILEREDIFVELGKLIAFKKMEKWVFKKNKKRLFNQNI